jgi:hypothetical protein
VLSELSSELVDYRRQTEAAAKQAELITAGLTGVQLNWHSGGSWSIAECIVHLNLTGAHFVAQIDRAMSVAQRRGWLQSGPFRYSWFERWFVRSAEPPPRRRFKAPRQFTPVPRIYGSEVLLEFYALQERIAQAAEDATGIDLVRPKVPLPALPLMKISLGQALALVCTHQRRHLWQAEQVRNNPEFPHAGAQHTHG